MGLESEILSDLRQLLSEHGVRARWQDILGMVSPLLGLVTSHQEQIEWHLRIVSLLVDLLVGILSLVSMVRKLRRR